jgi:hypothetical protein
MKLLVAITLVMLAIVIYISFYLVVWVVAVLGKKIAERNTDKEPKTKLASWSKEKLEIISNRKRRLKYLSLSLLALFIVGLCVTPGESSDTSSAPSTMTTNSTVETEQEKIARIITSANTPTYKHLKKNPDKYKGVDAIYTGKVVQAQEGSGETHLRIEVTKGEYDIWSDVIFVVYSGTTDVVEDDIVKVYGTLQGDYEYESQAGWKIHVPRLDAEVIKITQKSK